MSVVDVEGLELEPEEVEAADATVEAKEVDAVHSPFSHMLNNLVSGGGRQGRSAHTHTLTLISHICQKKSLL